MPETSITYSLPMSVVRVTGMRTTRHDSCLTKQPPPTTTATTALAVVADPSATSAVQLHQGWLRQTQADLVLTDDGRLSSASSESTGDVGVLVKAVVSTATTLYGVARGAGMLTKMRADEDDEVPEVHMEPVDRSEQLYREAHAVQAALLESYQETVVTLENGLAGRLRELSTGIPTKDQLGELQRLQVALGEAHAQLGRLEQHFKVWRAAQVVEVVEKHQYDVPLDEAAAVAVTFDGRVTIPDSATESRKAWEALGIVVEARPEEAIAAATPGLPPFRGVHVRQPRAVQIKTWRRSDTEESRAELVSVERRLVVDGGCRQTWFPFNTSIWAKRTTAVTFSAAGGLASYAYSGDSVAAALGKTLSDLPADVSDGLEQAGTIRTDLTKLQVARNQEALARTKLQVDQLQAQLSLDGLAATEHDYAQLEQLKQQKLLLETSNAVVNLTTPPAPSDLTELQHEVDRLKLQRELAALKIGR